MIRFLGLFSSCLLTLTLFENPAAGQAMVENALAASAAATTTAPTKGVKNATSGVFDSLDKTLKSAQDQVDPKGRSSEIVRLEAPVTATPKTAAVTSPAQAPLGTAVPTLSPVTYEDPATIPAGIGYEELRRRFGPPAIEFTVGPNRKIVSYLRQGGSLQVEFRDGKVTSAEKPNR
jgi:hypothetical protein